MHRYTLDQKIHVLDALRENDDYDAISAENQIPVSTLRTWYRNRDALRHEYQQHLRQVAAEKMTLVQHHMADKALELVNAMDTERINNAPLNQLSSALGVLIDRFLKLQESQQEHDAEHTEQVIRYEFRHPDGSLRETPYHAEARVRHTGTLQGGGVRATLGQDGTGEGYTNGESRVSWNADMVAGSDLPDGESRMARYEDDDDERNWYHD